MSNHNSKSHKEILGVVSRKDKNYWTKIGVAFENSDGSYNLRFDFFPVNCTEVTVQLREPQPRKDA